MIAIDPTVPLRPWSAAECRQIVRDQITVNTERRVRCSEESIRAAYRAGMTIKQIAADFGISDREVRNAIPPHEMRRPGRRPGGTR